MPGNRWGAAKRAGNLAKHGVDFVDLDRFAWDDALLFEDLRRDYGEARMIALGRLGRRVHVVVFVNRPDGRRIISARKANDREIALYVAETDPLDAG